jgi:hypothetical protein
MGFFQKLEDLSVTCHLPIIIYRRTAADQVQSYGVNGRGKIGD